VIYFEFIKLDKSSNCLVIKPTGFELNIRKLQNDSLTMNSPHEPPDNNPP